MKKIYESENLYFTKLKNEFIEEYIKMYMDETIQKNLFKKKYSYNQISNWVNKILNDDTLFMYSIFEKSSNDFVGNIQIIVKEDSLGEIIISITPIKQNNHYGTESIMATIEFCKNKLELKNFELLVKKENIKAINCYKNVGFCINPLGGTDTNLNMKL